MKKDNKAIIQIGIHKINDMFYNSGREPIHNLQIEGTFTEIELPDVDGYRCEHRNSWCGTMAMSSRLSNVPPPPPPTTEEQDYIDFTKKANDRIGRDTRSIDWSND